MVSVVGAAVLVKQRVHRLCGYPLTLRMSRRGLVGAVFGVVPEVFRVYRIPHLRFEAAKIRAGQTLKRGLQVLYVIQEAPVNYKVVTTL
jgi:hypothetical protein